MSLIALLIILLFIVAFGGGLWGDWLYLGGGLGLLLIVLLILALMGIL